MLCKVDQFALLSVGVFLVGPLHPLDREGHVPSGNQNEGNATVVQTVQIPPIGRVVFVFEAEVDVELVKGLQRALRQQRVGFLEPRDGRVRLDVEKEA